MFIWLTNPTIGQVLVNLNLVTAVPTCKCYDCACNASYDECNHGYCITCFECLNESKAVHNIYLCTGYERMVANGNENSE